MDNSQKDLFDDLFKLLDIAVNEEILLKRISKHFYPRPTKLASTDEEAKELERKISDLSTKLGGPPDLFIRFNDDPIPVHDTYCQAAISEMVNSFHRSYNTICKAHMYFVAVHMFEQYNDTFLEKFKEGEKESLVKLLTNRFWENAEIGFIRLASYWDRVGQLFDSIFFNIRQYERDGFPNVIDRIKVNYLPIHKELSTDSCWIKINDYQKSEQPNGLKWLLRRRNLLVHSLYLRDTSKYGEGDEELFISLFNHLEETIKNKLKSGSAEEELKNMHTHLELAASLFPSVLSICNLGVDMKRKM